MIARGCRIQGLRGLKFSPGCDRKPSKSFEQGSDIRFRNEKNHSGCYMENQESENRRITVV